jgi:hypothetical protein
MERLIDSDSTVTQLWSLITLRNREVGGDIIIKVRRPLSSGMLSQRYQLKILSGTLYRVALFRTDVSENTLPPSSGAFRLRGLHSSITVETVTELLHSGIQLMFEENCLLECFYGGNN